MAENIIIIRTSTEFRKNAEWAEKTNINSIFQIGITQFIQFI